MELTQAQHLMWLGQKLHPQAPLYNMVFEFRIWAELDVDLFRKAFATLLQASDNLRTIIREADGEPQQIVLDTLDFQVPFIDFSNEANPDAVYTEWLDKKRAELFRL
ncbi:MAG: hypothetical protein KC615_24380, partial [Anaerolineae bacterium]|nr:hypothetical protein [Anaerolineae bacterium]